MANILSISKGIYYSTEFKKALAAMFVCVAMTLGFLAITEPVFAGPTPPPPHHTPPPTPTPRPTTTPRPTATPRPTPTPTPAQCVVCHRLNNGHFEEVHLPCSQVPMYLAQHPGSCAGHCPCHVTGVQNP